MYRYSFSTVYCTVHFAFTFSYWFFLLIKAHWRRLYSSLDVRRMCSWTFRPLHDAPLGRCVTILGRIQALGWVITAATFRNLDFARITPTHWPHHNAPASTVLTYPILSQCQSHPHEGNASSKGRIVEGTLHPGKASSKVQNARELRDTSLGDELTRHRNLHVDLILYSM